MGGKGRKYGGGSDRLLHPTTHVAAADHLADLDEEDVWSVGGGGGDSNHRSGSGSALPRQARRSSGLSLAFEATAPPARQQQNVAGSAPVSVPEWLSTSRADSASESEDYGEWVPPHEYLLQRRGGRGSATSVLEGAGRTLKGRDMSRVRDAVWSKTGFFG